MDLIVSLFIAELVSLSIENYNESLLISLIPIIILVSLQIFTSKISFSNKKVRDTLDGKPSVIINRGKINFKEMLKQRYNIDDLFTQLRIKSIKSIEEVDYAILEPNGKLSVFKKNESDNKFPIPVIINGTLDEDTLIQIKKSKEWVLDQLNRQNILLKEIFYCFYQDNSLYIIEKNKIK